MKQRSCLVILCGCCYVVGMAGCRYEAGSRDRGVFVDDTDRVARRLEARALESRPVGHEEGKCLAPSSLPAWRTTEAPSRPAGAHLDFKASPADLDPPGSPEEFVRMWHHKPVLQGLTGQCWSFAATSFFESEVHRLTKREIKLSEMYAAYWEFVEKARRFVRQRGNSEFPRGSEPDAVIRLWRIYGVVPASAYPATPPGRDFYDDRQAYAEMREYLRSVRQRNEWDEERVVAAVRTILDRHFGPPPTSVEANGRRMSPQQYLTCVVGLDLDNYVCVMSLMQEPFYRWCGYSVPDNWWHSRGYYNVPLDDFVRVVRRSVDDGVSACLGIDNTEPGLLSRQDVAFVPTFDIPPACIDDAARQLRFSNGSTTDDHVVHLVGACERGGQRWYLIKDSGTKPRNGRHGGYIFYREDYIKLKVMIAMLPRDVVETALGRSLN